MNKKKLRKKWIDFMTLAVGAVLLMTLLLLNGFLFATLMQTL